MLLLTYTTDTHRTAKGTVTAEAGQEEELLCVCHPSCFSMPMLMLMLWLHNDMVALFMGQQSDTVWILGGEWDPCLLPLGQQL